MVNEGELSRKYGALSSLLDERSRRLWAAAEVRAAGRGGFAAVVRATGMSSRTVARGLRELDSGETPPLGRIRRRGGGRKLATSLDPGLMAELERLLEPTDRRVGWSPFRWTCKGTRRVARELRWRGYQVSHSLVAQLLHEAGYRLRSNGRSGKRAGVSERRAQFRHVEEQVCDQLRRGEPVISVELRTRQRHDGAPDSRLREVDSNGDRHVRCSAGWVSSGVATRLSSFAVSVIRRWWRLKGRRNFPHAGSLLIVAEDGGSDAAALHEWKSKLQRLVNETGLSVRVCHVPRGTTKWNSIADRTFFSLGRNHLGRRRLTDAAIVNLIAAPRTQDHGQARGARYHRRRRRRVGFAGRQANSLNHVSDYIRRDWNYTIRPERPAPV